MATNGERASGADDLASMALDGVVETVSLLVSAIAALAWSLLRRPLLVLVGTVVTAGWLRFGAEPLAVAALGVVVALVIWRIIAPDVYFSYAGRHLAGLVRGVVYPIIWRRLARRAGLTAYDARSLREDDPDMPAIVRVRVTRARVERILLRLPVGMSPDDVATRLDHIATAFRASEARIVPHKPGFVWVELVHKDPLARVVTPTGGADPLLSAVPLGRNEDGSLWAVRLRGTHLLIAGATGSGKGSVLWAMAFGLRDLVRRGTVEIWGIDPKGGMELGPGKNLFARFEAGSPEAMCATLEDLVTLKDERARALADVGLRLHEPTVRVPHVVVIIDELATLTAFAERAVVRRIEQALGLLLTQGRACGITVVAAVQDPGKDVVTWRDLFPTRIALRLDNPIQTDMVLGDGARDLGARPDHISELTPGVGYVRVEGTRAIRRVRAAYLDDDALAALNQTFVTPPTEPAPVAVAGPDPQGR